MFYLFFIQYFIKNKTNKFKLNEEYLLPFGGTLFGIYFFIYLKNWPLLGHSLSAESYFRRLSGASFALRAESNRNCPHKL